MDRQPFPVLASKCAKDSDGFLTNREANLAAVDKLNALYAKGRAGGGEKYVERHRTRGKLLPRERIDLLLDKDSYFLELLPLAGNEVSGHAVGASVVGGIGLVSGVECMVSASESTVKGGAIGEFGVIKGQRLGQIADENCLPAISLTESAGADLPNQSKIFVPGGQAFRGLTQRSKRGLPTVCVVFGSSTAGGAYMPGMSDYAVMVKDRAQVYLAGPPLVRMATGEETDHEELGGAEMHSRISGVSDFLAEDEQDAIRLGRQIISHLQWKKDGPAPEPNPEPPRYSADELLGIASADIRVPFDPREVIARIADGSRFSEFKPLYGSTLVCGWARIHGYLVGILANHGTLFSESANKGAQFIALCNQRNIPLLFLQNTTGFMVGKRYEQEGIIKNGAKLINAVSNSEVPAVTIMIGASYGAGNYAMSGRAYAPRFLFTWPNHRIAVMGGKQLGGVLEIISREKAAKRNEDVDENKLAAGKMMLEGLINKESDPFFASGRCWDDGVIDPRLTRDVLGIAYSAIHSGPVRGTTSWGIFRH